MLFNRQLSLLPLQPLLLHLCRRAAPGVSLCSGPRGHRAHTRKTPQCALAAPSLGQGPWSPGASGTPAAGAPSQRRQPPLTPGSHPDSSSQLPPHHSAAPSKQPSPSLLLSSAHIIIAIIICQGNSSCEDAKHEADEHFQRHSGSYLRAEVTAETAVLTAAGWRCRRSTLCWSSYGRTTHFQHTPPSDTPAGWPPAVHFVFGKTIMKKMRALKRTAL